MVGTSTSVTQRDRAIEAATDLARRDGLGAITSVAVAQRLGVTQSAVYRHIRDVDELRTLAIHRLVGEVDDELAAIVREVGQQWSTRVDFTLVRPPPRRCVVAAQRDAVHARSLALRGERDRRGDPSPTPPRPRRHRGAARERVEPHPRDVRAHDGGPAGDVAGPRPTRAGRHPRRRPDPPRRPLPRRPQALVTILKSRSLAAWTAFSSCMEARF